MTTPSITALHVDSTAAVAQTYTTPSIEPTAGTKVFVCVKAVRQNHATAYSWSITNSGAAITWTDEANSGDTGGNFAAGGNVFSADAWTGGRTITVDPFATANSANHYAVCVFEVANYNGLEQAIVSNLGTTIQTLTLTYGSALTSNTRQAGWYAGGLASGTATWDTPPTNFTEVASATDGTARGPSELIESTANTATGVTHGRTVTTFGDMVGFAFEFSEDVSGGATATPATIAAVAAVPDADAGVGAAPATAATTAAVPDADAGVGAAPAVLPAVAAVPDADAGVGAAPATLNAPIAVPDADVSVSATPATASLTTDVPQATPNTTGSAAPASIDAVAAVPDADAGVGAAPAAIPVTAAVPTPISVGSGDTITVEPADETDSAPNPTVNNENLVVVSAAFEGQLAGEVAPATFTVLPANETDTAPDIELNPTTALEELLAVDDWPASPPEWGQWGTKVNEWMDDLAEILRQAKTAIEQDGTLLWSGMYEVNFANGTSQAISPIMPTVLGNNDDMPVFGFPTTIVIEASGVHGVNSVEGADAIWDIRDQYDGVGNVMQGNKLNDQTGQYTSLGSLNEWVFFRQTATKQLAAGEQGVWSAGYAVTSGDYDNISMWQVKLYRGHILPITTSTLPPTIPNAFDFDDGQPGVYGNFAAREDWFWNIARAYFEPQHNPADTGPLRVVYVSPSGGGDGLSVGNPTTLSNYMSSTGITPAAGDQVRVMEVGPHNINSGTERSLPATAADPIRFVRHDPAVMPVVQNSAGANSTWPLTDANYLGFHGLDIDGNWPTYNNIWGLSGGQRFSTDTGMERCHHWDVWHCPIHDMAQNTFTFEGTNGNNADADHRARFCHLFACDIYNSGQDATKNFSELTYFGSGTESNDHAHDICIEACDIRDGPSGEAIDLKMENFNTVIISNLIHNIRCTSQGAIAAFFAADLYYHYNVMWDVDRKTGELDGCGIWTSSIDADTNLMWNFGITAFVSSRLNRGTMGVVVRRLTAWDMEQTQTLGSGDLHHQNTGTNDEGVGQEPTIDFDTTCISDDGDQGTVNAAASDFVGPDLTGDAEAVSGQPGSAFKLAASSSIAATAGALGKE